MEERKLTKEDIDSVRGIEGFPIAKDEDIISLSRPPYYTACPNPFIADFICEHGTPYDEATDDYHREPFAADVSEGKNDPIYNAHSYHTKVPYKAIMRYILHYTKPGDIVFDGFCGTGMTGVAAQMCGCPELGFKQQLEREMPGIEWGARKVVLNDLSPAATFIAYNYNTPVDVVAFEKEAEHILSECEREYGWMYETQHVDSNGMLIIGIDGKPIMGKINYVVWSDVFICPSCTKELVYFNSAFDADSASIRDSFHCTCGAALIKRECDHATESFFDPQLGKVIERNKQVISQINYSVGKRRFIKTADRFDVDVLNRVIQIYGKADLKTYPMMFIGGNDWGELCCPGYHYGITHSHHFYTARNYVMLAYFWNATKNCHLRWAITGILSYINKKQSFTGGGGGMPGVLAIASLVQEKNVIDVLKRKTDSLIKAFQQAKPDGATMISTGSSSCLPNIPDSSIDYIFIDPPFGRNIIYSEANFLHEALLSVFTNNKSEAIVCRHQKKKLAEYQELLTACIVEFVKKLKPNRWVTIEFHNSKDSVWNAIQEALMRAGLIIGDVRTLDKEQGSFKQVKEKGAVKQDLIISAYKPKESFVSQFTERVGDPEMAWEFVRQHLQNVPIAPASTGKIEIVSERQDYLLFDRMVAYHIMNGTPVPMDAHTFYAGLRERFIQRDGMFFLTDQVNEYDERRQKMELQDQQISLFISDEKSAIMWLNAHLSQTRQTSKQIQPKYLQDLHQVKFEQMPELLDMLKENFLCDEDDKWYVPVLSDKADLEKLRRKRLIKDFYDIYAKSTGRIKNARTEAIRVGFDECWKERNYSLIVKVGDHLPETVLQEDPALLMYYDNAANRM